MRLQTSCAALLIVLASLTCLAAEIPAPPSLDRGYHSMYNLQFGPAQAEFAAWQKQHPQDALGPVSEAAGLLFSELNRLGVLETRLFQDDSRFEKRKKLTPDPDLRMRFNAAL